MSDLVPGEPEQVPVHDVLGVGGGDRPPGAEELRAIVARSSRHRRRSLAAATAAALLAGGLSGYLVASSSAPSRSLVATASSPTTYPSSRAIGAPAVQPEPPFGVPTRMRLTRVFTRRANGVDIRAFTYRAGGLSVSASCREISSVAEVSTPAMVGAAPAFVAFGSSRSRPVLGISVALPGEAEGDPTAVATVFTGPGVGSVHATFVGGESDQMAPVDGRAVLAAQLAGAPAAGSSLGTVEALGAGGRVLASAPVREGSGLAPACQVPVPLKVRCTSPPTSTSTSTSAPSGRVSYRPAAACSATTAHRSVAVTPASTSVVPAGSSSVGSASPSGSVSTGRGR